MGPALTTYLEERKQDQDQGEDYRVSVADKKKGDAPMLTGDPEFDAWEMAETAVERTFK